MKEKWPKFLPEWGVVGRMLLTFLRKLLEPAVFVGNRDRVRKPDEKDPDTEKLVELDRTWRQMLKDDPWMQKLMMHVRLLLLVSLVFFAIFLICGLTFGSKNSVFPYIMAGFAATIPYWIWIGKWNKKIEIKVFEAFKKRFGKHFHLR